MKRTLTIVLAIFSTIILWSFIVASQENNTLEMRVSTLELKVKELESRINKIESQNIHDVGKAISETAGSEIDLSSPENAAKGFWEALSKSDLDKAKKYYITDSEAASFGTALAGRRERELKQLEKYAANLHGMEFLNIEKVGEKSLGSSPIILLQINLRKDGQTGYLSIGFLRIREGYWKIADMD
ncbi:MAG: hypothetical protein ACE5HI_16230 [bacterium]